LTTDKTPLKQPIKPNKMIETLLYGCKINQPDYMEEILYQCKGYTNKEELLQKGKQWAEVNGYDRLILREINLSQKTDFIETITI
jgi:hypothetical protein